MIGRSGPGIFLGLALLALTLLWPATASAQVYWDLNGNTAGSSGGTTAAGTWDQATTTAWSTSSAGTGTTSNWAAQVANGGGGTVANFAAGTNATGSYTVTVSGNVGDLNTGYIAGIAIDEGTLNFAGTGTLYLRASGIDNNTSNLVTFGSNVGISLVSNQTWDTGVGGITANGVVSGTANLTKAGAGTLTLSGTNTFTGITTINAGTLSVGTIGNGGVAGNLGQATNAAANLVLGGGTLQYTGTTASTNRNFTLSTGTTSTIDVSSSGTNLTLSGASTATTGGLTKAGAGTLTLSGANLYTGTTTVSAGTLAYGASNALASGAVAINGGTLDIGTYSDTVGAVTLTSGTLTGSTGVLTGTSYAMQSGTVSAILGGTGNLTKTTAGTVTLSGTNTYTGVTTISAGTLSVGTIGNGGVAGNLGQATNAANRIVFGGGTLQYTGATASTNRSFTLNTGSSGTIDVTQAGTNLTLSGASANTTGSLTKIGAGTLTLSGANAHTGATNIGTATDAASGGTLAFGVNNALSSGAVNVYAGTLNIGTYSDTIGALNLGGAAGTTATVTGSTGVLTLGGNLSYDSAGSSPNAATISANLNLGGANRVFTVNNSTAAATDLTISGNIAATNRTLTVAGAGDTLISGNLTTGTGGLTKQGTGTLTLAGTNTYTGVTTISAGTLSVGTIGNGGVAGNLGQASNAANRIVINGGTLQYTGATGSTNRRFTVGTSGGTLDASGSGALSFTNTNSDAVTLAGSNTARTLTLTGSNTGNNTLAGVIGNNGSGATSLTKDGAGTWLLSGANTYTGATTVNAGILKTGAANRIADTSNLAINNSATFELGGNETVGALSGNSATATLSMLGNTFTTSTASNTQYQGTITGWGTFAKAGTGDLILSGNSTYSGPTNITGGTLAAAHNNALGTSYLVTVSSGATLGLQGNITLAPSTLNLQGTGDGGVGAISNISGSNTLGSSLTFAGATTIGAASGTLTLTGSLAQNQAITMQTAAGTTIDVQGSVYGSSSLTKTGTGTLTFSGGDTNSASGGANITDGTVILQRTDNVSAIGQGAVAVGDNSGAAGSAILRLGANNQINDENIVTLAAADGRLDLNGYTESIRQLQGTGGQVTLGAGSLTIGAGSAGNSAFAGVISGTGGSLTKATNATLALAGTSANTYTGATNVNDGTVTLGKTAGLDATGTGALNIGDGAGSANSAIVQLLASNQINNASAVTINVDGRLDLNNFSETLASVTGSGSIALGSGTLTLGDASSFTYSGIISGTGNLTKVGSGTVALAGTNTYTGVTTISAGTLSVGTIGNGGVAGNLGQASNAAANLVINSGTLQYTGAAASTDRRFTLGTSGGTLDASGTGAINFANTSALTLSGSNTARTLTLTGTNTDANTLAGIIANNGTGLTAVTKTGTGTWALTGTNTYTGVTTINNGTLSVGTIGNGGVAGNLGQATNAAANLVLGGGTLRYTGATASTDRNFTLTNGTTSTIDVSTGATNLTFAGISAGTTGALVKAGAGTLTLTGDNLHTGGTTVNAGTLNLSNNTTATVGTIRGTLTANSGTVVNATAIDTLGYAAGVKVDSVILNNATFNNTAAGNQGWGIAYTLNNASTLNSNGGVSSDTAASKFAFGNYTTVNVTGTGTSTITGRVDLRGDDNPNTDFTVASGAALNVTAALTSTNGTTGFNKFGDGTMTVSGANTYTGTTTIANGVLVAASNSALGAVTGNVAVNAGATLSITGGVNVTKATGVINPAAGTLSLAGAGETGQLGALVAGTSGQTSQYTGNITLTADATIGAADNLIIIGDDYDNDGLGPAQKSYYNQINLGANTLTLNTTSSTGIVPTYLDSPSYILDASNIYISSTITGTGGVTKTGPGTANLIFFPSEAGVASYTGDTLVTGGKLIIDGADHGGIVSTNIIVGNASSPGGDDSVVLQMGQLASPPSANYLAGDYNNLTNVATSSMTVYEDGLFNMNRANNALVNLTMQGGHVTGRLDADSYSLLTVTGGITTLASAQTSLIDHGELGLSNNAFTFTVANGAATDDLRIDSIIHNGIGFTGTDSDTSLTKTGTGTLVFTAANDYQGVTSVDQGALVIRNNNALGIFSSSVGGLDNGTVVKTGAQLQLQQTTGGANLTVGGVSGTETLTLNGTGISSTGALYNATGDNTYHGFVRLQTDSRITAASGTTLTISNTLGTEASIMNGTGAGGQDLAVGGPGNVTIGSAIGGLVGDISKDGSGTLTLAGNNAYAGTTTVGTGGAIKVTHNQGLAGTAVTVNNGGALQFAQNAANQDLTAISGPSGTTTIAGTGLSNGGAIQNLTGTNTYLGSVTLGANSRITADSGSALTFTGNITGAGYALDAGGAGNTTYNGVISGSGSTFTKTDTGTVTLGGTSANTFTGGLFVNEGTLNLNKTAGVNAVGTSNTVTIGDGIGSALSATLALQKSNQMPDSTDITINSDGRLAMGTSSDAISQIAGTGQIDLGSSGHLTIGGDNSSSTFDGTFESSSTGTFTKSGTGDLTFTQDISYDGTFNLGGGKLILDDMDLTVTNLNITANSTIDFGPDGNSHIFATTLSFLNSSITLNIVNWTFGVDAFYSTFWPGATYDLVNNGNTVPMSQITFAGWDKSDTGWDSYDDQIYPKVPEPSTYGLMFIGACVAFFGYRRWRNSHKGLAVR